MMRPSMLLPWLSDEGMFTTVEVRVVPNSGQRYAKAALHRDEELAKNSVNSGSKDAASA